MEHVAPLKRPPPPEPVRLLMAAAMAFIKGGVISAILVAPFLGIWAAVGTTFAFSSFCTWLAHKKGPGVGVVKRNGSGEITIEQAESKSSKMVE